MANSAHLWTQASHDLLKYVYDDDFLLPFALDGLQGALERNPDSPLAFARRHVVDEAGHIQLSPMIFAGDAPIRLSPAALATSAIKTLHSPVGEPSSFLIRRSALPGPECLHVYQGLPVRHLIDVCLLLNTCQIGRCVGLPDFLSAFRRHRGQATQGQSAPTFSAGVFEWELFLRGTVSTSLVPPAVAAVAIERLLVAYQDHGGRFTELKALGPGLIRLRTRLQEGEVGVLDEEFRAAFAEAHRAIDARLETVPGV